MINWNAIPATYNEAWTYLEMLGKLVSVVNRHDDDIKDLQTEVTNIWENFANYYTKDEADAHFISEDDLLNYYTKEEADARFALLTDLIPIQQQINALKTSAALGGSVELILVPSGNIEIGSGYYGGEYGTIDVTLGKYEALSEQPEDWTTSYTSYYYIDSGTGKYTKIPAQTLPPQFIADTYYKYIPKNYDSILLSVTYTLNRHHNISYTKTYTVLLNKSGYAYGYMVYDDVAQVGQFVLLEEEPNDWTTNYTDYYRIDSSGKYVHVEEPNDHTVPPFAANTYYYHVDDNTATIAGSAITTSSKTNGDIYFHIKLLESTDTITNVIVTAVTLTEAGSATPEAKAALYALADVDGDGEIGAEDPQIIGDFAGNALIDNYPNTDAGFEDFMREQYPAIYAAHTGEWKMPDVDGSGYVTMTDAQMVLGYYTTVVVAGRYEDNPETFYLWMNGYIH